MHNDEDIDVKSNPGDGSSGGYYFFPAEQVDLTAAEVVARHRTMKLVPSLMDRLANDGVDMNYIIKAYQLVHDNHTTQKGKRRVPSDKGRELIIALYDKIADYRDDLMQTSDYGPYPSRAVFNLRCAMVDIIKMYDEYCAAIRDLIVPPAQQPVQTSTSRPETAPAGESAENAMTTESISTDVGMATYGTVKLEVAINLEELGSYFIASFRGLGGTENLFSKMVDDVMRLTTSKEIGMVAYMLFNGKVLNRHKPRTFAKWIRTFFINLGKTPPQDTHQNKYKPNDKIQAIFAYLP